MSISILLLTLNEEANLPACLAALSWCDDIVLLDSFSTDLTVEIAELAGARVYRRQFDDFAGQRNFALETIPFRHEWIFHLDADEIMTEVLRLEMESVIADAAFDAFLVPSKMILFGKWLRYSGMYPCYQVRLTRQPRFRFRQVGHGQREDIDPSMIGKLQNPYLHYSFSKGIGDWFDRHNRYSTAEALESIRHRRTERNDWPGLFSADSCRRRRALKMVSYRLPFRPAWRFFYMYFLCLGFLDGIAGFTYCTLLAVYEYMIVLKVREIESRGSGKQAMACADHD